MSDREKVVRAVETCFDSWIDKHRNMDLDWHEVERLKRDALELLEKQVPKPVKVTKNTYNYEFYDCPNCGRSFELTYYKKPAYCDKCGQAVKWDDK